MLLNSSVASPGLVVIRFRNMSVAMTELPNRYDSTIWNALKNMNMNPHQTMRPDRRERAANRV